MAENFSDIFEGYEDKSIEELGSSLLSRQAEINQKELNKLKNLEGFNNLLL